MTERGAPPRAEHQPLYDWAASLLREEIESGRLRPHEPIPSERRLGEMFGISRMTARQAVQSLRNQGYVYRRNRQGTFVAEPRLRFSVGSFTQAASGHGHRPGAKVLRADTLEADETVRKALGLPSKAHVHFIRRLRSVEDEPIAIESIYLPADQFPDLLAEDLSTSLWTLMKDKYGVAVAHAEAKVEAVGLNAIQAQILGGAVGGAAISLTRRVYEESGRLVEFAHDIYRGDRTELHVAAGVEAPFLPLRSTAT